MTPKQIALDRLDALVPAVQILGARFTKEVEQAWRAAYGLLAATMKQAPAKAAA